MAVNAVPGQEGLYSAGRKFDDPAVIGPGSDGFRAALVNAQVTIVTEIQVKANEVIHKKTPAEGRR